MLAVKRIEPGSRKLWIPGAGACLCSQHFTQDEFELYGGQKRLKAGVIPSVFSFKVLWTGEGLVVITEPAILERSCMCM